MTLHDVAEFLALLSLFLLGLSGGCIVVLLSGNGNGGGIPALTWRAKGPKYLLEDLENPKIVAGGPLGLVIKLAKSGVVSLVLSGICWAVWYVAR